jgi:hypothetical protein
MKRIAFVALVSVFAMGVVVAPVSAPAEESCAAKAVSADGKPLTGAAKTSSITKCKKDACTPKAVGSDGKPLKGAALKSFMTKCEKETT